MTPLSMDATGASAPRGRRWLLAGAVVAFVLYNAPLFILRTRTFTVFAIYRLAVAAGILILWYSGKR